jgi:hypothetical protein
MKRKPAYRIYDPVGTDCGVWGGDTPTDALANAWASMGARIVYDEPDDAIRFVDDTQEASYMPHTAWVVAPIYQSRYCVQTATAAMPQSCWGRYGRVAVLEMEPDFEGWPAMISTRAKGVKRIVQLWDKLNVGKTAQCAYSRAENDAYRLVETLNAEKGIVS